MTPSIEDIRRLLEKAEEDGWTMRTLGEVIEALPDLLSLAERAQAAEGEVATADSEILRLDYEVTLLRPRAQTAETGLRNLLSQLRTALAEVDGVGCPLADGRGSPDRCPKCGATVDQNCGPWVRAASKLEDTVRALLQPQEPKP